jgi:hypothetical protein
MSNRSWNFTKANQVITAQGTMLATHRALVLAIKNSILTVPGCTIKGSSNSVAAGMDGVDRWTTGANLVWGPNASPFSWIVFKFANMGGAELLLRLPTEANGASVSAAMSKTAGYTGGTISAEPTATDAINIIFGNNLISSADGHYALHVPVANDGDQFTILYLRSGLCYGFMQFGMLLPDVPTAWSPSDLPVFAFWSAQPASAGAALWTNLGNASPFRSKQAGTLIGTAYASCEGWQAPAGGTPSQLGVVNTFDGKWPMYPSSIVSESATRIGKLGTWTDVAFVDSFLANGSIVIAPDGEYWAVFDDIAIPWTTSAPYIADTVPILATVNGRESSAGRLSGAMKSLSPSQGSLSADPDTARWTPIVMQFTAPAGYAIVIVVKMGADSSLWMVAYDSNLGGFAPLFQDKSSLVYGTFTVIPNGGWMKPSITLIPYIALEAV